MPCRITFLYFFLFLHVFPLVSCTFLLLVISFVHPCLPLAVPICLQSGIFSALYPLGFPFHLTHPLSVHPCSVTLSLGGWSRKPSQQGREPLAHPLREVMALSPLSCCISLHLGEAGGFGHGLCGGVEEPGNPCSHFSMPGFCSGAGSFLASSHMQGRQQGAHSPLPIPQHEGERRKPPSSAPVKASGPGAVVSEAAAPEQPVAAGRSGCGGGKQQSQNGCRDGQGNEMVDSRQGERFQNRKGGERFHVCSPFLLQRPQCNYHCAS